MVQPSHNGDHMMASKLAANRFDVVVLQAPDEDKEYIKWASFGMPKTFGLAEYWSSYYLKRSGATIY